MSVLALVVAASVVADATGTSAGARCQRTIGGTLTVVRVERDTTLPFVRDAFDDPADPRDTVRARPGTPMPAARVRLLQVDARSRAVLAEAGVGGREPVAYLRAEPYSPDCRTVRWRSPQPWVVAGDVGLVRGSIAGTDEWIDGAPVLVVAAAGSYPYPRQRGLLPFMTPAHVPLAPAAAVYSFELAMGRPLPRGVTTPEGADSVRRTRALAWARANRDAAEREPVRTQVHDAILDADWHLLSRDTSRLRGTWRVTLEAGDTARATWYFRSTDRPAYRWREADTVRTTADLLADPHSAGYVLLGYAAPTRAELPDTAPRDARSMPLAWLGVADQPTSPANASRRRLSGTLEFKRAAVPPAVWPHLELYVPPVSAFDSVMLARGAYRIEPPDEQRRVPIVVRIGPGGAIAGDTVVMRGGRALRVTLERVDTLSYVRAW